MAGEWISELAEAEKAHDKQDLMREHLRAREAQVIAAKNQSFWEALVATVEADVFRFQREFADDPRRSLTLEKIAPHGFRVFRSVSPGVSLDVQLQSSSEAIEFRYKIGSNNQHAPSEWSGTLAMRVDVNGGLYLSQYGRDFRNFEDISRMFLERVFKGAFR